MPMSTPWTFPAGASPSIGARITDAHAVRFDVINGLPGLIVSGPRGLVQTNAFEFDGDAIKAIYVVRNPDKLRHLASS